MAKNQIAYVELPTADIQTLKAFYTELFGWSFLERKIRAAGATITMALFSYPGGKRFHFLDPSGNEMAMFQPEPSTAP